MYHGKIHRWYYLSHVLVSMSAYWVRRNVTCRNSPLNYCVIPPEPDPDDAMYMFHASLSRRNVTGVMLQQ